MTSTSEGTIADQVCGNMSDDVQTISNNLDIRGQNLAVENEAIGDPSPLVDTATETVEVDAEYVTSAKNTEFVAGSVSGYMKMWRTQKIVGSFTQK